MDDITRIKNEVKVQKALTGTHRLIRFTVGRLAGVGWPLVEYLRALTPRYEPHLIALWAERGDLTIDGGPCRTDQPVATGQLVELKAPLPPPDPTYTPPPLELLYEDEHLAMANKQPGHLAHQAGKVMTGTLLNQLQDLQLARGRDPADARLVNRIDRDTSGLVLISWTLDCHIGLAKALEERRIHKRYQALCHGVPGDSHGRWTDPIGPPTTPTVRRVVRADGQSADTEFTVEASVGTGAAGFARLGIDLHTGRQHQIRVHASHHGHPLVGDWVYGAACAELPGQALHAAELELVHPITGALLHITAPLPRMFTDLWQRLSAGGQPTPQVLNPEQRSKLNLDAPGCV